MCNLANNIGVELTTDDFTTRRFGEANKVMEIKLNEKKKKAEILRNCRKLRDLTFYKGVFINPDLTKPERQQQFELRQLLKEQRKNNPEKTWKIYKNAIIETTAAEH